MLEYKTSQWATKAAEMESSCQIINRIHPSLTKFVLVLTIQTATIQTEVAEAADPLLLKRIWELLKHVSINLRVISRAFRRPFRFSNSAFKTLINYNKEF